MDRMSVGISLREPAKRSVKNQAVGLAWSLAMSCRPIRHPTGAQTLSSS